MKLNFRYAPLDDERRAKIREADELLKKARRDLDGILLLWARGYSEAADDRISNAIYNATNATDLLEAHRPWIQE